MERLGIARGDRDEGVRGKQPIQQSKSSEVDVVSDMHGAHAMCPAHGGNGFCVGAGGSMGPQASGQLCK